MPLEAGSSGLLPPAAPALPVTVPSVSLPSATLKARVGDDNFPPFLVRETLQKSTWNSISNHIFNGWMIEMVISPTIFFCMVKTFGLFQVPGGCCLVFLFLRDWKFAKNMSLKMDFFIVLDDVLLFPNAFVKGDVVFSTSCRGLPRKKNTSNTSHIYYHGNPKPSFFPYFWV